MLINRFGIDELKKVLKDNITAFSGNSGVGKSSLINSIFEDNMTQEGLISDKNKKGKNTTTCVKLYKIDENSYDLYVNVTQTLATKIFKDNDKSNNLLRVGNNMVVDFQSEGLRGYIPNGDNYESIKHIYYIDNLSNKNMTLNDSELLNYKNKTLIWEKE